MPNTTTNQPVQSPLQNLARSTSVNSSYTPEYPVRVGQTFNTGTATGTLKTIEVTFSQSPDAIKGFFVIALYELQGTNLIKITESMSQGDPSPRANMWTFAAGTTLRSGIQYAFLIKALAPPFTLLGSQGNAYANGTAFFSNQSKTPLDYNPIANFDLYFKVTLV